MAETKKPSVYEVLSKIDTKEVLEKKGNLDYLSWSHAFDKLFTNFPDASYEIVHWDGKPYLEDENLGYMVETRMTIEGVTREMWLPVMDFKNKAIPVGMANMMDINKTIMRCLTKNIGMFGLGLNVYAGEDLPLGAEEGEADMKERLAQKADMQMKKKVSAELIDDVKKKVLLGKCKEDNVDSAKMCALYKVGSIDEITMGQFKNAMDNWEQIKASCGV